MIAMRAWVSRLLPVALSLGGGMGTIWTEFGGVGQELPPQASRHILQNWRIEQGLPQISVTSIAQTPDGYLWVGTFNGLARFDGVRFTIFDRGNTPALDSSGILQLKVDEQGDLWMVTARRTLVTRHAGEFRVVLKEQAYQLMEVESFSGERDRRLLLLDLQGKRHWIEEGRLAPFNPAPSDGSASANRFLLESGGTAWLGPPPRAAAGVEFLVPGTLAETTQTNEPALRIQSATASASGAHWVATTAGIHRVQGGQMSTPLAPLPPEVTPPITMQEDGAGSLWIGKWGKGIYHLDPAGHWQRFDAGDGLGDLHVGPLFRDREGSLWVGTGQGGLHRVRRRVFQTYHAVEASGSDVVMSVTQDRQDRLWFGLNGAGLHTWSEGRLIPVTEPPQLRNFPLTYSVLADRRGALWVGLYGIVLLRLEEGVLTHYELRDESAADLRLHALFEDPQGTLWVGSTRGLLRYQEGQFTRWTGLEGAFQEEVLALAADAQGTLFIGTGGGGLKCLRNGQLRSFGKREGLADEQVSALLVDQMGTLWVGTLNGGLARFREGRFASLRTEDGLPSNTIGSLLEDDAGRLWISGNRGILQVQLAQLNDYLDGKQPTVPWRIFGLSDGLATLGCTGGHQTAAYKARDGRLWFSTIKGVAVANPAELSFNALPPPVVIEQVVMDDRVQPLQGAVSRPLPAGPARGGEAPPSIPSHETVPPGEGPTLANPAPTLRVPPRTHRLEFHFTGLSLMAPENVRFRYRLEPFDRDWIQAGTRRVAYYSGVPPGRYRLAVTACNNDGVWNEAGAQLGVTVLPPWWMTWWFRGLAAAAVVGGVFGWYENRLHRLRREHLNQEHFSRRLIASQENERRRIAGELHDGMGQDLLIIANQAQLCLSQAETPAQREERLKDISETAKRAIHQARQMAHDLRPGLLEELGLTKAIRATLERAAQASGIPIAINLADVDGLLPPEFEASLFRILQECLNNLLKHAAASEAIVSLKPANGHLRLVVQDNGRGFAPETLDAAPTAEPGFGLRQMAERVKMMGGRLVIQSRPGHGTQLTIDVPRPRLGAST